MDVAGEGGEDVDLSGFGQDIGDGEVAVVVAGVGDVFGESGSGIHLCLEVGGAVAEDRWEMGEVGED